MRLFGLLACAAMMTAGCGVDEAPPSGTGGGGDGGMGGGEVVPTFRHATGTLTWTLTFDAEAIAAGATDCSYTRSYEAFEDHSAPWLCPSCDLLMRADASLPEAELACYRQVYPFDPSPIEWLGIQGEAFYRSKGEALTSQGGVDMGNDGFTVAHEHTGLPAAIGGRVDYTVAGSFALDEREGDVLHGFVPPETYGCGWPKSEAPAYEGDYALAIDATMPDGVLRDVCDEPVRLHDFAGEYLVVVMSAFDCMPCQEMATDEQAFVDAIAAQGIDVEVITLLAPSLGDTVAFMPKTLLESWTGLFGNASPVLADRGWGVSMFYPVFGLEMAYPSWMVVAPDLRVLGVGHGYEGYAEHEALIAADAP